MTLAVATLLIALLTHNFGLAYVADYSSRDTPVLYLITGLWAGNAGSLLFWGWVVSLSGAVLLWRSNKTDKELMPNAQPVILFTVILSSYCYSYRLRFIQRLIRVPSRCYPRYPRMVPVSNRCCRTSAWSFTRRCCWRATPCLRCLSLWLFQHFLTGRRMMPG